MAMQSTNDVKQISIVIPVYNAQQYLPDMLDSVLRQSCKDFELILVNDGSTDSSSQICHAYANQYDCIRVFDRENHGVAATRNFGIGQASGEFIWLMDSDDILLENALQIALDAQRRSNSDVVIGGMEFYYDWSHRGEIKAIDSELTFLGADLACHYAEMFSQNYLSPLWNKLIRRSVIANSGLKLWEGLSMYEDYLFSMGVLREAAVITCVPSVFYRYVLRKSGSLSHSYKTNVLDMFRILREKLTVYTQDIGKKDQTAWASLNNLMIYLAYECVKNECKAPRDAGQKVNYLLNTPEFCGAMKQFRGYGIRYRAVHLLMKYRLAWLLRLYIWVAA